jgi:hypothetical protein
MTWTDLTVGQYQRIYPILTGELSDQDKVYQLILELEGKECSAADFERKISEYAFLSNIDIKPKPIKRFKANGRWYRFNYDIEKMPAARYIEVKTFMGGDFVNNMHMILASAIVPLKRGFFGFKDAKYEAENHGFYAEDMKAANFMQAYGSLVFFYLRLPLLTKDSHPYTPIAKTMWKAKRKAAKILSQNITGGYLQRSAWQSLSASLWSRHTS